MCSRKYRMVRVRAGIAAAAIAVCGVADAKAVLVYEWSENGGTPVISNAPPPAGVKQYTIQTMTVPPLSAEQRTQAGRRLAAYRAALAAPAPPAASVTPEPAADGHKPR